MTSGLDGIQVDLVNSVDKAKEFISWLGERRPYNALGVDIETGESPGKNRDDALSPWHGNIRLVQVGDGMHGWAIPWDGWSGVFYEAMNRFDGPIVCHNIAFEAKWFSVKSEWEIPWERAHDTMIMAHLIDPLGAGGLKPLSAKMVDPRAAYMQTKLDQGLVENGWTWGTVPIDYQPYWTYGALDPILTMRIWEEFYKQCGPGQPYHRAYELEMATRKIVTRMEINGARVNLDYAKEKYEELIKYTDSVKEWGEQMYPGTSLSSGAQLGRLFESLGGIITERTTSGAKSCNKDQLSKFMIDDIAEVKNLANVVSKMRKADKLAGTYFLNIFEKAVDGVLHPSIKTLGARTSRMSITDPALQTLPKDDETVRRAFIPKDEDHVLITSDLDQVEFRMFASLSGDKNLIELFNRADIIGSDPFTEIGREVYQEPNMVKSDPRRGLIKGMVYGRLYGAGIAKQALTAGVKESQMKSVSDAFDSRFPSMIHFQKQVEHIGVLRQKQEGQGYVNTWTGRRLPCDDGRAYTLTNYLIQGGAAEIFKSNLVKLDQADLTEMMVVPVHDEIVLQVPRADAQEIMQTVKECMTTTEGWAVPLTSGIDGPMENWGSKYEH